MNRDLGDYPILGYCDGNEFAEWEEQKGCNKMEKMIKHKWAVAVLICVLALVIIFIIYQFGWRVLGFNGCTSPNPIIIKEASVENNDLYIELENIDSFGSRYKGYVYEIEDSVLKLGVKFRYWERVILPNNSEAVICIKNAGDIDEIILTNGNKEKVYRLEDGKWINEP